MRRFYAPSIPAPGAEFEPEPEEARHLFKILRAAPGEQFAVFDGHGATGVAEVVFGRRLRVMARTEAPPPARRLALVCAAPRRQKLDAVLRQAVELGVTDILLVDCERSVARPDNDDRLEKLLFEACKQSGNPFPPRLRLGLDLTEAAAELADAHIPLFFGSVAPAPKFQGKIQNAAWAVGPEGGFSENEENLLRSAGAIPLHLGGYTLRLETAAVAGLAVLLAERGE